MNILGALASLSLGALLSAQAVPEPITGRTPQQDAAEAIASGRLKPIRSSDLAPRLPPSIYGGPYPIAEEAGGRSIPAVKGAVVAWQRSGIHRARARTKDAGMIGPPLRLRIPAGVDAAMRLIAGKPTPCIFPDQPPGDARGNSYDEICLRDRDGDGRAETAHLLAGRVGAKPLEVGISPVSVEHLPADEHPEFLVQQRIVVEKIGRGSLTLLRDSLMASGNPGSMMIWSRDVGRATLKLAAGSRASLAGLTYTAVPGADGNWSIAVSGAFDPWVSVRQSGTEIAAGRGIVRVN